MNFKNPLRERVYGIVGKNKRMINIAIKKDYDSLIISGGQDVGGYYDQYVAFEPNQIKLADGTNTTFDPNNDDIRFATGGTVLLAPNGNPSNLTTEQYKLVRTPEFKAWFGDWENDPENASKVVDSNGEPLVVYHGSQSNFTVFDKSKGGRSNNIASVGYWFTPLKNFAENFAESVWYGEKKLTIYAVFLSIKNIKKYSSEDNSKITQKLREKIEELNLEAKKIARKWDFGYESYENVNAFTLAKNGRINEENLEYYSTITPTSNLAIKDGKKVKEITDEIKKQKDQLSELYFSDSYQKFRTDIHKTEGGDAETANIGGLGMSLKNQNTVEKYKNQLNDNGFGGILIENTKFDSSDAGGINDQYIAFEPNQIKLADGTNTTFDPNNDDIRFEDGGKIQFTSTKSVSINVGNDLYKFQYQRGERGDTDKPVWFAKLVSVNEKHAEGRLCFKPEHHAIIYGFSLKEIENEVFECLKENELWIILEDEYGNEKEVIHVDVKYDQNIDNLFYKQGGRTVAQTPAPSKERIYGSNRNKPRSSKDSSSAESIKFDNKTLTSIENKVEEHNEAHPDKKVNLATAKAVVRRGMGAYSKSHRPTISGGKANSRVAWGLARLNAFLYKVINGVSKSGKYSQDNDLLDELGIAHKKFAEGGNTEDDKITKAKQLLRNSFDYLEDDLELLGKGLNGMAFVTVIDGELYVAKYTKSLTEFWLSQMAMVSNPPHVVTIKDVKKLSDNFEYGIIHKYTDNGGVPNKAVWNVAIGIKFKEYLEAQKLVPPREKEYVKNLALRLKKEVEDYFGVESIDTSQPNWGYEDGKLVLFDIDGNVKRSQYEEWMQKYSKPNNKTDKSKEELNNMPKVKLATINKIKKLSKRIIEIFDYNLGDEDDIFSYDGDLSFSERRGLFKEMRKLEEQLTEVTDELSKAQCDSIADENFQALNTGGDFGYDDDSFYKKGGNVQDKEKQLEIIKKHNPAPNNYNTWIRSLEDIKTAQEVFSTAFEDGAMYPDFDTNDMNEALESDYITIYSSYPIKEGVFVTPSRMNATDYAGGDSSKVFSKKVRLKDVAWIDESEGQYAPIGLFKNGGLIAPNGNPSNLTPTQYKLVRTPEFKAWFGDWENDPAKASKVVDENGEPLIVYHGTSNGKFYEFSKKKMGQNFDVSTLGFYFTNGLEPNRNKGIFYGSTAVEYSRLNPNGTPSILEVFLNVKNPININADGWYSPNNAIDKQKNELTREKQHGYDGVISKAFNTEEFGKEIIVVAFEPNQIKLADGTNTTFDPNSDDIRYKKGGKLPKKSKGGDCYVVAGRIALNNQLPNVKPREFVGEPYVIHAQVTGQGAIAGLKYGHAWIEDDIYVYDYSNGRELKIPKEVYYKLGQVIEQQPIYFKYTFGEAKRKMAETGHFGSWDLITESGL